MHRELLFFDDLLVGAYIQEVAKHLRIPMIRKIATHQLTLTKNQKGIPAYADKECDDGYLAS